MKGRRRRTEAEWDALMIERIKRLPKSAPECQKKQLEDKRKDTSNRITALIVNGTETHIIVVQEISGKYNLPGGRRKKDESPNEGLFREICEEVGLELQSADIAQIREYKDYVFYIRLKESNINNILVSPGAEIDQVFWWPLDYLISDLEREDTPFSKTTTNLLPRIREIVKPKVILTYDNLKEAVINNDLKFLDNNLDYYSEGQVNSVLPIAIQTSSIAVVDKLFDYSNVNIVKMIDLAISRRRNEMAKYLLDN